MAGFSALVAVPSARGGAAVGLNASLTRSQTVGLAPGFVWRRASVVQDAKAEDDGDVETPMPRVMSPG